MFTGEGHPLSDLLYYSRRGVGLLLELGIAVPQTPLTNKI